MLGQDVDFLVRTAFVRGNKKQGDAEPDDPRGESDAMADEELITRRCLTSFNFGQWT